MVVDRKVKTTTGVKTETGFSDPKKYLEAKFCQYIGKKWLFLSKNDYKNTIFQKSFPRIFLSTPKNLKIKILFDPKKYNDQTSCS